MTERQARRLGPPYLQLSLALARIRQKQQYGTRCIALLQDNADDWSVQGWVFIPDMPQMTPPHRWTIWRQVAGMTQLQAAVEYVQLQTWLRQRTLTRMTKLEVP